MANKSKYFYIGGIGALAIYLSLLFALAIYFLKTDRQVRYATEQKRGVEVMIAMPEPKKLPLKAAKKEPETKKEAPAPKEPPKKSGSASLKQTSSAASLFSKVDTSKLKETKTVPQEKPSAPSRFKGVPQETKAAVSASRLVENLALAKASQIKMEVPGGIINQYFAEVQKLLYENWLPNEEYIGYSIRVMIIIDNKGNFDYNVLRWSGNPSFDSDFKEYLQFLKTIPFPPYKDGDFVEIVTEFIPEG